MALHGARFRLLLARLIDNMLQRGLSRHSQATEHTIDSEGSASVWGRGSMLQTDDVRYMVTLSQIDEQRASQTLDELIDLVADLLPVNEHVYPELASRNPADAVSFCLRHSALHFSKTAGKLAAFVEDADHGKYAEIQTLQAIVAASLVNSLKLADEIGISGPDIIEQIRLKFDRPDPMGTQMSF